MIALISRWKLKNGCTDELVQALKELTIQVEQKEPETLSYNVHITAKPPLDSDNQPLNPPAKNIPNQLQTEVIFYERYANAAAFSAHVTGEIFNEFRQKYIHHFYQSPDKAGWPQTDNTYLELEADFTR
ncbi:putative quinol monooxygenase [Catenovulum agarivorans]|uniref:putative quinol monooxygenase n=1 Tax=Catenovulum agarivorans TaxID=1172192 RepID=UPI00035F4FCD|nr:antibiotic biosynthesis monooxygenase [Catenovulum agarivorans]